MNPSDIVSRLIELINPLIEVPLAKPISASTGITADLGFDSLKVMDLIMAVEDEYDVSVPINALADIRTVGELAELVSKTLGQNA
ncbi:acyl carrier protein [Luteibacter aegosomatissinici]|uniref:acyl carrier protein n=1 Tax=Luteibacter aegosomatissinici TaxID=2911539 RepID=UPI001FF747F0|nr:acyl carrier protein [Luteibacter aegosomatissinici]UPG96516.1 acyl carrier protein [Luteibacter aegosomatissinici]